MGGGERRGKKGGRHRCESRKCETMSKPAIYSFLQRTVSLRKWPLGVNF